eukprot:TRINITY_DN2746_c0_g1_i1.p2 TRINITY_DN2746_c0_g1~~TRINITY_DN2746_c0_g1_i1.p2  ORF type:complete len:153 (+),score=25.00 TRINITY_DN2746_c0_g1_i1:351-809(+)
MHYVDQFCTNCGKMGSSECKEFLAEHHKHAVLMSGEIENLQEMVRRNYPQIPAGYFKVVKDGMGYFFKADKFPTAKDISDYFMLKAQQVMEKGGEIFPRHSVEKLHFQVRDRVGRRLDGSMKTKPKAAYVVNSAYSSPATSEKYLVQIVVQG